jgi:transcriptional regulator with XRE-family HTH domain
MTKSNIKNITSIEGCKTIADYLGVSEATISAWRKRGYASLPFIAKLSNYADSHLTTDDFIDDITIAFRKGVNK